MAEFFRFLIFSENIGILDTIKNEIKSERMKNVIGWSSRFNKKGKSAECLTRGIDAKNRPEAGVGKPRNQKS